MSNEQGTKTRLAELQRIRNSLSPEEMLQLLSLSPNTSTSPPSCTTPRGNGPVPEKGQRTDLSGEYLSKRGKTPSVLLNEELDAIIAEHEDGGDTCPHKSFSAAPFISIVQSTGYGKTRAILQLAKSSKKKVVYLLCKSLSESWLTPSVVMSILEQMADDGEHCEDLYERKWHKFLTVVESFVDNYHTPEALYNAQITDKWELGDFYNELFSSWEKETTAQKIPLRSAMKQRDHEVNKGGVVTFNCSQAEPIKKGCLVLCFDEVSAFNKPAFKALRRAAKAKGIICVFADTTASICKLIDTNGHSSKVKGGNLGRFVAPIFALNTADLRWSWKCRDDDYKELFCAGRPRWLSHYIMRKEDGDDNEKCIESLICLARRLLLNEKGDNLAGDDLKYYGDNGTERLPTQVRPGKIAAFTSRFSLGAESRISSLLVKHSCATVIGISEDREIVSCAYPSEPVLAEASARFTAEEENNLRDVLHHVRGAVHGRNKLLDPPKGDSGEMCAAALLGYSMDVVRKRRGDTYISCPVPLSDFLSILYGDRDRDEFTKSEEIEKTVNGWNVNFTHFDRPTRTPTQSDLMIMWKRRLAYYVPEGAEGLDLLIAIRNNEKDCYGTIRVKVKNCKNEISVGERSNWLYALFPWQCPPYFDDPFSVSLLLSVNSIKKSCRVHDSKGNLIYDTMLAEKKRTTTRSQDETDQGRVLQLATCFPSDQDAGIGWISAELRNICSLETSKQVSKDYFCHAYTDEVLDYEKERGTCAS